MPGGTGGTAPRSDAVSASVARRLSRAEIDATVRDLLGDATNPASRFLAEDEYTPFDNDYTRQKASAALIDSLEATADDIAARVLAPATRSRIVPCTPSGPGDAACFRQVIETVGRRLFRRPLSEDGDHRVSRPCSRSRRRTTRPCRTTSTPPSSLMLRSMLQDPEFLYRIEIGTPTTDARRSPSEQLRDRHAPLVPPGGERARRPAPRPGQERQRRASPIRRTRRAEATRLLADPRARDQVHRFHAMWLGYRAIPGSADLLAAFDTETTALIDKIVFDQPASYLTLFSSSETYVNDLLADQYGLPRPAGGAGWVPYGASGRAGILSHGAVLAAFSKFSDTSPTQRGILVQTRLLCNVVQPPPANVNVDQPPPATASACKLDRYAAHRSVASCGVCHNNLDPIGTGLEQYDIGGKFRTHDDGHPECPLDGARRAPGLRHVQRAGRARAEVDRLGQARTLLRRAPAPVRGGPRALPRGAGRGRHAGRARFKASDDSLTETLLGYVASDRFALRQEDAAP